jgi:carbohydrate kinase (thermoresistant glucokinase family)
MGVSGSGKTTLAKAISEQTNGVFLEGDDYHPKANIQKMKSGISLNDSDRKPWLKSLNHAMVEKQNQTVVVSCSALKRVYRRQLEEGFSQEDIQWIFLDCDQKTLETRLKERDHFMPLSLLKSQLDTLEPPRNALRLDASQEIPKLMNQLNIFLNGK